MNILFVHETDYINKVTYEWHTLAEGLVGRGHNVFVIDYPCQPINKQSEYISRTSLGCVLVYHMKSYNRVLAYLDYENLLKYVIKQHSIEAIIQYSVPTNGLSTINVAHSIKTPVIFRSIDILHRLVRNPILRFATKQMEKMVYSKVDLILANTPNYADYCRRMGGKRIETLLMPVDTDFFKPMPKDNELMKKHGIKPEDKVILYMGSLNFDFCGLDEFIKEKWKYGLEAKLLVVGGGKYLEQYKKDFANDSSIIWTGYQDYSLLPRYINLADVCISPFIKSKETDDIFPGKVIQYLACGKPVVATALKGLTSLDISGGVVFVDNYDEMVNICCKLLSDIWSRGAISFIGKAYAGIVHDQELILDKLEAIIKREVNNYGKV